MNDMWIQWGLHLYCVSKGINENNMFVFVSLVTLKGKKKPTAAKEKLYSPGDIIFAKLKGFPWWPGRIENEKDLPEHIMKIRRKQAKSTTYTIFFFGSNDYQFFNPKDIRPFEPNTVKKDLEAQKYKTRDLQEAISQAIAATKKTSVDVKEGKAKKGKQKKVEETKIEKVNQQKKEDVDEDTKDEPTKDTKAGTSRGRGRQKPTESLASVAPMEIDTTSTPTTARSTRGGRGRKSVQDENKNGKPSAEEKASIEKGKETNDKSKPKRKENMAKSTPTITGRPKRTRRRADSEAPQDANDKKRRRKSLSTSSAPETSNNGPIVAVKPEKEANHVIPENHLKPQVNNVNNNAYQRIRYENGYIELAPDQVEEFKKTKDFLRVYQLRHRLQKYVYNRKPGDIPESEYGAISSLVKDIENEKNMTIDLLKYTKIGKVIKLTSAYDYGENDKFDIAGRCNQIIENWKHLVFEYQRDPEPLIGQREHEGQVEDESL